MITGAGLKAAIEAQFGAPIDDEKLQEFCDAVVNYLVANTVVLPGTFSTEDGPVTGEGLIS